MPFFEEKKFTIKNAIKFLQSHVFRDRQMQNFIQRYIYIYHYMFSHEIVYFIKNSIIDYECFASSTNFDAPNEYVQKNMGQSFYLYVSNSIVKNPFMDRSASHDYY